MGQIGLSPWCLAPASAYCLRSEPGAGLVAVPAAGKASQEKQGLKAVNNVKLLHCRLCGSSDAAAAAMLPLLIYSRPMGCEVWTYQVHEDSSGNISTA